MKVILTQEVKNIGPKGALVEVAEGYARNYLIPRGLAIAASQGNLKRLDQEQQRQQLRAQREAAGAKAAAEQLRAASVRIPARAGEGGKLFGSVTAKDIAEAIRAQLHLDLDKRKIELKEPLKTLGEHNVTIRLHSEATVQLRVAVDKE